MSERSKTDTVVRDMLEDFRQGQSWEVCEEESSDPAIQNLLRRASKRKTGYVGKPEFIIHHRYKNVVVVVEDKYDINRHQTPTFGDPVNYAVDGAVHYAKHLNPHYDVVAIGCSGDKQDIRVSSFLLRQGCDAPEKLSEKILKPDDYLALIESSQDQSEGLETLRGFSRKFHNDLRDYAKLTEERKPVFLGGVLCALKDPAYRKSYREYRGRPEELAMATYQAAERYFKSMVTDESGREHLLHAISFILVHPEFKSPNILLDLVADLDENVYPLMINDSNLDMLTDFYREFIRYSGGDGKGLGIVMTPTHMCELLAALANLHPNSKVLDICMGTAGFLVASLNHLKSKFGNDRAGLKEFQKSNLIGVEQQNNMFALSCFNMMLRGVNPENFYLGNCFNQTENLLTHNCNVGFLNPPYSQKGNNLQELDFVEQMLNCLVEGSLGFAIVPMSCALESAAVKRRLLAKHTLVAAMSLPADLFYPVGVVPCLMVFKAHVPHNVNIATWFGMWQDDRHIKIKKEGRVDYYNEWTAVKEKWVDAFLNQREIPGMSIKQSVTAGDEWCAEAYVLTPYDDLTEESFLDNVRANFAFNVRQGRYDTFSALQACVGKELIALDSDNWELFKLGDLFDIRKGRRIVKKDVKNGKTPFVSSTEDNNGISRYVDYPPNHKAFTITVNYDGSVGEAFYHTYDYYALDSVNVLYPKFDVNFYRAMFLITIIKCEKFRFSYGRKWHLDRMKSTWVRLPSQNGQPNWELMEKYIMGLLSMEFPAE